MKNKLNITLNHRAGSWKYNEHLVHDIKDEDGSPLCRVGVYLQDLDGRIGSITVYGVILKVDGPLPNGVSSTEYLGILSSLEKQGSLKILPPDMLELGADYLITDSPCTCSINSSPFDPEFEEDIKNLLEEVLAEDDLLDKIRSMIKSIRDKSASNKEDNSVTDTKEKSTSGVEDDIK